jgi:cell division protein FtsI (penicillin-binding protein 3)
MTQNRAHAAAGNRTNSSHNSERMTTGRMLIVAGIALVWMIAVLGRLGYLQLIRHSEYMQRAQRQQQHTIEITPKRGGIYDRNGNALALSMPVDSAFAVPTEIKDQPLAAMLMSKIVGVPREELEARLQSSKTFVWIARKLPPDKADALNKLNLKGIYFQKENQRYYPKREMAAHVLGFVNLDEKGIGGIESELQSLIGGKAEKILVMADGKQRPFDGGAAQRERGASVVLTIDEKIQYIAERELATAIAKTHAMAGTVIVLNPNNGEILAMANWPKFNPNTGTEAPPEDRMNRAVSGIYEPGSTFKLVTLAAAFDQGMIRPDEVFDCENGKVYISGHRIRDHKPFGLLTVSNILAQSSDVGAIKIALRLGSQRFYDYIRAFGFGERTGVDIPGESRGMLQPLDTWSGISIGSTSMGQEVGVTPIQLVAAVSAIANGGMLYRPHVIAELKRDDKALAPIPLLEQPEPKQIIKPETAATMRTLMEGVILHGTGTYAHLDGWTAAGKTGTAQKIDKDTGRYSPTQLIASFSGFAPINNPAITVLVSLDSPVGLHEGGQVAAPVFKRIAEQTLSYMNVPRDVPVSPRLMQAAYKTGQQDLGDGMDEVASVDFSAQPDQLAGESASSKEQKAQAAPPTVTVAVDEGGDIPVPDFTGKTMRDVTDMCLRLGLNPVLVGSSLAVVQTPVAGAKVRHGAKITVQFGTTPAKQVASARNGTKSVSRN